MSLTIDGSSSLYDLYNTSASSTTSSTLESSLSSDLTDATDDELMDACKSFEAYFIEQVYKEMKSTVESSDENEYTEYFGDMLYQQYAEMASDQGSLGIAQMLYESMQR